MSWRIAERDGLAFIEYDILRNIGIRHGFVVKRGGRDIDEDAVYGILGRGKRLVVTEQTHSERAAVVDHDFSVFFPRRIEADGLMTDRPGIVITIHTADCVPVLIASRQAAAVVHAGWKGTAKHIVRKTAGAFIERYGSRPEDIYAVVGPGIASSCYPVGIEVAEQFGDAVKTELNDGTWALDLKRANFDQLAAAGLRPNHVHVSAHCTRCDDTMFHSYRREGQFRGTMIAFMEVGDAKN
ncbi:MAG: peptidoglycan editing factor PgeF [Candidatus Edwardsbacteria bacterium]|nr:peptidoglycan editing factor PgeF [Candidatus Edwardsbacteria bacterium]